MLVLHRKYAISPALPPRKRTRAPARLDGKWLSSAVLLYVNEALAETDPNAIPAIVSAIKSCASVLTHAQTALTDPDPDVAANAMEAITRETLCLNN